MIQKKKTSSRRKRSVRFKRSYNRTVPKIEKKHFDTFGTVTIGQSGTINLLTGVTSQGVQDTQRIGDSIFARTLFLRLMVYRNQNSQFDNLRIVVVQDRQGYNAPIVLDVFEGGTVGSGYAPFSQYNHYLMSRFKILMDRSYSLSEDKNTAFVLNKTIRINSKCEYVGASTFRNQVYLIMLSDNSNLLQLPVCNFVARLIYSDP